jgi:hypothetical protein
MMHVIDVVLNSLANLFRSHRYPPVEKLYSVVLFIAGLSLRDLSERLWCIEGIRQDMGSQVLIPLQAVQKGEEAGRRR